MFSRWPTEVPRPSADAVISVPSGDGRNPSPSGEEKFVDVPGGDESPPTEVGGLLQYVKMIAVCQARGDVQ